jgi:hypothetical protein
MQPLPHAVNMEKKHHCWQDLGFEELFDLELFPAQNNEYRRLLTSLVNTRSFNLEPGIILNPPIQSPSVLASVTVAPAHLRRRTVGVGTWNLDASWGKSLVRRRAELTPCSAT